MRDARCHNLSPKGRGFFMANRRRMTAEETAEYERLVKDAEQIHLRLDELKNRPTVYGYARVSTTAQAEKGNSLEAQESDLQNAGAEVVVSDAYTGTRTDRPELEQLLSDLRSGDTIIVTKLDRIARNLQQGVDLIDGLNERGITVKVLNLGVIDNSPTGRLIRNVMLSFAEFERDMIMERTREGKEIARTKDGYREGRPKKYTDKQLRHAVSLLGSNSYSQVVELTGISKSTLTRAKRELERG